MDPPLRLFSEVFAVTRLSVLGGRILQLPSGAPARLGLVPQGAGLQEIVGNRGRLPDGGVSPRLRDEAW